MKGWSCGALLLRLCLLILLALNIYFKLPQLLLVQVLSCILNRADGVEQIAVLLASISPGDACRFRSDETLFFQYSHMLFDGVPAQPHRGADGLVTWPALMGPAVLAAQQVTVDCDRARLQLKRKNLIGQREIILVWIGPLPECVLYWAPPSVCSATYWMNRSLGTTILFPILSVGNPFSCRSS